jgi:transketolase
MRPSLSNVSEVAKRIRRAVVEGLFAAGGGHYGGALSVVDILLALYRYRPIAEKRSEEGDRLILSKGHSAAALYAVFDELNGQTCDLSRFGTFESKLQGHPDMLRDARIHFSSGSLGQGLAVGLGMAFALREKSQHVWVILGDGECQEGQIWEAAMVASRYALSNLHVIIDCNGAQECGWAHDLRLDQRPLPEGLEKWAAFGWLATEIDGHNDRALGDWISLAASSHTLRPSIALAATRKGAGVRLLEDSPVKYHCCQLTAEEIGRVRAEFEDA